MELPVELKGFGRPPSFGGGDDAWPDWSFVMKAYLCMMNDDLSRALEQVEEHDRDVSLAELEMRLPGIGRWARQAY